MGVFYEEVIPKNPLEVRLHWLLEVKWLEFIDKPIIPI